MSAKRVFLACVAGLLGLGSSSLVVPSTALALRAGFGQADITPQPDGDNPVWLAGYGPNRAATAVHDPLFVRCVVLEHENQRVALISVDSIGLQLPDVQRIRDLLPEYSYVLVSSTHNHEAPDVIGIWGQTPFQRGTDDAYLQLLVERAAGAVRDAEQQLHPVEAQFGTAEDETLVRDSRLPHVKDGVLRTLRLTNTSTGQTAGLIVQWNCHPESMGSRNTQLTADFPWATIEWLHERHGCPIVYLTGTVGGLMTPPHDRIRNDEGEVLREGDFEYTRRYGEEVGKLADQALAAGRPITLTPFQVSSTRVAVPVRNPFYRAARALGVLRRPGRVWMGDPDQLGETVRLVNASKPTAVETEVACLRLGELHVACIPGEIYPELVYGKFQEPADPAADYPDAALEPSVASLIPQAPWMLVGLANDEIGYIIPRRQWDQESPYAYGRNRSQYGEINSCGPDTAAVIMQALAKTIAAHADQSATDAIAP
jgi:hypothetical protein